MNKRLIPIIFCTILSLNLCVQAHAVDVDDIIFAQNVKVSDKELTLQATSLHKFFILKVFKVGFYLEESARKVDPMSDVAKQVEIVYLQNISSARLARETRKNVKQNIDQEMYDSLSQELDEMYHFYDSVSPGDKFILTYEPGVGTIFNFKGKELGRIEGKEFGMAMFSVWIGPDPISINLKNDVYRMYTIR